MCFVVQRKNANTSKQQLGRADTFKKTWGFIVSEMQNNVQNMQKRHQRTTPPPNLLFRSVLTYVLVWWHTREPYLASDGWTNLHPVNAFRFYNPNRTPTESKEQRTEGPKRWLPPCPGNVTKNKTINFYYHRQLHLRYIRVERESRGFAIERLTGKRGPYFCIFYTTFDQNLGNFGFMLFDCFTTHTPRVVIESIAKKTGCVTATTVCSRFLKWGVSFTLFFPCSPIRSAIYFESC